MVKGSQPETRSHKPNWNRVVGCCGHNQRSVYLIDRADIAALSAFSRTEVIGGPQIWCRIRFDLLEFLGGEGKLAPAFEELARAIARDGRIAAKQDAVHSDLAQ